MSLDRSLPSSIQNNERTFQDLQSRLNSGFGPRGRLDLYHQFFSELRISKNTNLYLSYYREIYEDYLNLFSESNLSFRSPQYLDDLKSVCVDMIDAGITELKDPAFQQLRANLEHQRIAVRFFTGDIEGALRCLQHNHGIVDLESIVGDNYERFHELKLHLKSKSSSSQELLEQIDSEWRSFVNGASNDMVWIPLVEKAQGAGNIDLVSATIQPLMVEVELRRDDASQDLIFFNNHPMANSELLYYQALDAVTVAKKHLNSYGRRKSPCFRVMFGFPDTEYFYTGESFGLGMGLAVLAQMEKITIQRTQHSISKNAVITGGLDVNGLVRPISNESLPTKIEAFHYSPFSTFVHPRENSPIASNTFELIEINDLGYHRTHAELVSDVIKDENVVHQRKITFEQWSRAHIRKNEVVRYLFVFLGIILLSFTTWFYGRDLNPIRTEVKENVLTAFNSHDNPVWTYEIFPNEYLGSFEGIVEDDYLKILIYDLDGDGQNEIIYSPITLAVEYAGRLKCLSFEGELLWELDFSDSLMIGESSYKPPFIASTLKIINGVNNDPTIVAAFTHHPWFPVKLALVSSSGVTQGTYYHSGSISDIQFIDVSGDGQEDVLFCGTNNEYRDGILGALDLANISGHSPQLRQFYKPTNTLQADHLFYFRFPKGNWLNLGHKSENFAIQLIKEVGDNEFSVSVINKRMRYTAIYQFDNRLKLLGASFGDSMLDTYYTNNSRPLYNDFSREIIFEKLSAIKSWNGVEWIDFANPE